MPEFHSGIFRLAGQSEWWRERRMRGEERRQRAMLVVIDPEQRVPITRRHRKYTSWAN